MKPQGLHVGRYLLERRLATGGMGEVFEAVQLGAGDYRKPVALKLLLPHLAQDPGSLRMFLDEAKLAARLHHPNVVVIHDVGQDDRRYYLAMELVRASPSRASSPRRRTRTARSRPSSSRTSAAASAPASPTPTR